MELNHPKTVKYIALTVKSVFLDHQKKVLAAKETELDEDKLATLLEQSSIHTNAELQQSKLEVYQLKQTLSERDWLVLEGKYILGYSQDELSELIGHFRGCIGDRLRNIRNDWLLSGFRRCFCCRLCGRQ